MVVVIRRQQETTATVATIAKKFNSATNANNNKNGTNLSTTTNTTNHNNDKMKGHNKRFMNSMYVSSFLVVLFAIIVFGLYGHIRYVQKMATTTTTDGGGSRFQYDTTSDLVWKATISMIQSIRQQVEIIQLQLPLDIQYQIQNWFTKWLNSIQYTIQHLYLCFYSMVLFLYYTMIPIVFISYYVIIKFVIQFIVYKIILQQLKLLSPHAIYQCKMMLIRIIQYQTSLSYREVIYEIAIITGFIVCYYCYKWMKLQTYTKRLQLKYRQQKQKIKKLYGNTIERIAKVSSLIAMMTPHVLYTIVIGSLKCFTITSTIVQWIACETALIDILQSYYPIIATILLIHDMWDYDHSTKNKSSSSSSSSSSSRTSIVTRSRQKQQDLTSSTNSVGDDNNNNKTNVTSFFPRTTPKTITTTTINTTTGGNKTKKQLLQEQQQVMRSKSSTTKSSIVGSSSLSRTTTTRSTKQVGVLDTATIPPATDQNNGTNNNNNDTVISMDPKIILMNRLHYWHQYWIMILFLSLIQNVIVYIPFVQRTIRNYTTLQKVLQQIQLCFWIWYHMIPPYQQYVIVSSKSFMSNTTKTANTTRTGTTSRITDPNKSTIRSNYRQPVQPITNTASSIKSSLSSSSVSSSTTKLLQDDGDTVTLMEYMSYQLIKPIFDQIHESVRTVVAESTWDVYVVQNVQKCFVPLVWANIVSKNTMEIILYMLIETREIIVPTMIVFCWPISIYGLFYIQYCYPLAKVVQSPNNNNNDNNKKRQGRNNGKQEQQIPHHRTQVQWLQYYILHSIVRGIVYQFQYILWFVPFATLFLYVFFALLGMINGETIHLIYHSLIQQELQAFGLLHSSTTTSGTHHNNNERATLNVEDTKIVRFIHYIVSKLPSAKDDDNDEDHDNNIHNNNNNSDDDDIGSQEFNDTTMLQEDRNDGFESLDEQVNGKFIQKEEEMLQGANNNNNNKYIDNKHIRDTIISSPPQINHIIISDNDDNDNSDDDDDHDVDSDYVDDEEMEEISFQT